MAAIETALTPLELVVVIKMIIDSPRRSSSSKIDGKSRLF